MLASQSQPTPAFAAFEQQLKTLCLREFPCGIGSWREGSSKKIKKRSKLDKVESRFSVTLKDFGAQHEKTETLEEYLGSAKSPWSLDYSWSEEAKQLREIAVKSPWLIDDSFVLNHFKTLRIVDKNVSEVDPNLLNFTNLEELTLSCNYISELNSKNLPQNLKVLEACANQVSDLSSLCVKPPGLIHLGLGYNKISVIGDYLTGSYWPSLLSLDLSHNNLSDLLDVVRKVGSLPKLRNLILQGNPLSLIPGYRGYTVDSLRKLNILDDIMISADERHYFKGLARRREFVLDEAKVKLSVSYIKGVPMPDEIKNPDEQPEFPVIERKYFVQFMFLADSTTTMKTEALQMEGTELAELAALDTDRTDVMEVAGEMQEPETGDQSAVEKNVFFTDEPDVMYTRAHTAEAAKQETEQLPTPEPKEKEDEEKEKQMELAPVSSVGQPWAEEIESNWTQMVVRDDLVSLRDFFKKGMQFSVVEEMTLCYPVIPEEGEEGSFPNPKATDKTGKDDKKKKKKGEVEQELKRNPPTYTTLATWHIPLEEFLEGEFDFQSVYTQGMVELAPSIRSADTDSVRKDTAKSRPDGKDKKKPPSATKRKEESNAKGKDRKGSAAKGGKDAKGGDKGKGGKGAPAVENEEEDQGPPPPLEVQISVNLHHWKTAMDSLKDEEERQKELQQRDVQT